MSITPSARPRIDRAAAEKYLRFAHENFGNATLGEGVLVLGVRGYYLDSMGAPARNDRGEYDDALVVISPSVCAAFNGNTDPSRSRARMAVLNSGVWFYKLGTHGLSRPKELQYPAFVQAARVTVTRDHRGPDDGWFGINIHRGGDGTTSSLGCQTVPPAQWPAFFELVKGELRIAGQTSFRYALVEESDFRAWVKEGGN